MRFNKRDGQVVLTAHRCAIRKGIGWACGRAAGAQKTCTRRLLISHINGENAIYAQVCSHSASVV
jgi:type II secretory pathway predicted ATPase ExeA